MIWSTRAGTKKLPTKLETLSTVCDIIYNVFIFIIIFLKLLTNPYRFSDNLDINSFCLGKMNFIDVPTFNSEETDTWTPNFSFT